MVKNLAHAIGRRKTSVARIYLRKGKGEVVVNGKPMESYFTIGAHRDVINRPLECTDSVGKFSILINVKGGGVTGQAEACLHGISRALVELDETNKASLKAKGFLTRDSRMVERKKYGQKGARRKFQFSKR
ncbi:MAG: 30S ribosomal protein S9 [Spirochaetaceae bacterium]|jgi:small subunit ribosomal protein S9|nr:30S ribosomal protein S9 [Spirochaetaceae bacterium]